MLADGQRFNPLNFPPAPYHRFVQGMNAVSSTMRSSQVVGLGQRRDQPLRVVSSVTIVVSSFSVTFGENPRGHSGEKAPTNTIFMCFSILPSC
jgi:hypothetical protein